MGGMVLETNMSEILARIDEQNKLEKQEVSGSLLSMVETMAVLVDLSHPNLVPFRLCCNTCTVFCCYDYVVLGIYLLS